ncbi:hypothetical protein [Rubritalea squalenifaciens]|nr:hypothetical protein [Rubritalea squalenifaciens]
MLQLLLGFVLFIAATLSIYAFRDPNPELMVYAMFTGSIISCVLLAIISGLLWWNLRALLITVGLIATDITFSLPFLILMLAIASFLYFASNKARSFITYFTAKTSENDSPDA